MAISTLVSHARDRRFAVPAVLALLLVLNLTGALDHCIGAVGKNRIEQTNAQYLKDASTRAAKSFLVLTLLRTGLDVIEGSTVGVSLGLEGQVEIGDIVQCLLDIVNLAWKTVLAGMVVLFALQILLHVAAVLAPKLLTVSLVLIAIHFGCKTWRPKWRGIRALTGTLTAFALILTLTLHAVLPLSVYGAAQLSRRFTAPQADEATSEITSLKKEVLPAESTSGGIRESVNALYERIRSMGDSVSLWVRNVSRSVIKLVAAYLFDCVVFPLGFFAILFWLTRTLVSRFLGMAERQRTLSDLETLLERHVDEAHPLTRRPAAE